MFSLALLENNPGSANAWADFTHASKVDKKP